MSASVIPLFHLTRLAFTELVRQPVCLLITLASVALSTALPLMIAHQLGQQGALARDGALAFELTGGAILAAYAAFSTLSREMNTGTILTLLSRPIGRGTLFLAKFAAVTLLVVLFTVCSAFAALLAERLAPRYFETDWYGVRLLLAVPVAVFVPAAFLNWRCGSNVPAWGWCFLVVALALVTAALSRVDSEGHVGRLGEFLDWRLVPAAALIGIGLLILAAAALGLAAHLPLAPTVLLLLVLLFAGLLSSYIARLVSHCPPVATAIRTLLPDFQAFWPADDLAGDSPLGWRAVGAAALYGITYTAGVLCLGAAAFRNRQF